MPTCSVNRFSSRTPEQTRLLGETLGRLLQTSRVLLLTGGLGSGKTCFVQGLALGLDIPAAYNITSPTYTLINEYPGRLPLFHVDLYRLHSWQDADAIGLWELLSLPAVIAIEWADRIGSAHWPGDAWQICFSTEPDDSRRLSLIEHGLGLDNLLNSVVARWSQVAELLK